MFPYYISSPFSFYYFVLWSGCFPMFPLPHFISPFLLLFCYLQFISQPLLWFLFLRSFVCDHAFIAPPHTFLCLLFFNRKKKGSTNRSRYRCVSSCDTINLYNAGFNEKKVKTKTGHRWDAVREYQVPGFDTRKAASDALVARGSSSKQIWTSHTVNILLHSFIALLLLYLCSFVIDQFDSLACIIVTADSTIEPSCSSLLGFHHFNSRVYFSSFNSSPVSLCLLWVVNNRAIEGKQSLPPTRGFPSLEGLCFQ